MKTTIYIYTYFVTSVERKVIICICFCIHMYVMDINVVLHAILCAVFLSLSLSLSFWQCLIGTSCRRLRRERERLNAGRQSIVGRFCGVCVVKLCCCCCCCCCCRRRRRRRCRAAPCRAAPSSVPDNVD